MAEKMITVELDNADPKKKVVKFSGDSEHLGSIYLSNAAVKKLGGCENGVKVIVTAL